MLERRNGRAVAQQSRGVQCVFAGVDHEGADAALASDGKRPAELRLVRMKGLEPSRPCGHTDLNRTRLPVLSSLAADLHFRRGHTKTASTLARSVSTSSGRQ
jgi:hypothetical protein